MKYLVLLVGCADPKSFVGKCYKPFVYNGEVVKVVNCSNKEFYEDGSNFCIIQRKRQALFGQEYLTESTVFISSLEDYSIEVSCSEF
jgi:hypothetical protein